MWVNKSVDIYDPIPKETMYLFDPDKGEGGVVFISGKIYSNG